MRGRAVPDRTASSQESTRGDSGLQTEGRTDPDHERLQRRPLRNMAESYPKTESVQRMVGSTCIPTFEVRDKAL